ncbi:MAG: hypothetical protein IJ482_05575 [Alphaproteobacteria bacterium]|nr:hypothetical protein [Alphaproteobacteria bacterium]
MKRIFNSEQSGRSMVEMLGVLAIIGVLSVGGISGYSKAMAKFKLTKAQDQLTMLLMNIRTAYATSPSYAGLDAKAAVDYNLAPSDMITGTSLHNAFGGEVVLATANNNLNFSITFEGLGKETCASLASTDWGTDGLVSIALTTGSYNVDALPISLPTAFSGCSAATASNSITWTYY